VCYEWHLHVLLLSRVDLLALLGPVFRSFAAKDGSYSIDRTYFEVGLLFALDPNVARTGRVGSSQGANRSGTWPDIDAQSIIRFRFGFPLGTMR